MGQGFLPVIAIMMSARTSQHTKHRLIVFSFKGFSMYPFLRTGDQLLVEKEIHSPIKIGQILLFKGHHSSAGRAYTAHRVVQKIDNDRFITKGDNLFKPDPGIRRTREAAGIAVMLIRGRRLINIKKGLYCRIGKLFAYLSRKNFTPSLLMTRIKRIPDLLL